IIVLNLGTLWLVFLMPRLEFMGAHRGLDLEQLKTTRGAPDMPNLYAETYRISQRVRSVTPESATIFLPPGDRAGSFRAPATQTLFPRRLVFGDAADFRRRLKRAKKTPQAYFVFRPGWFPEVCREKPRVRLNDQGFGLCRLDG
ncbi:MAG: hypothetical protein GWM98_10705, partial [Nitrospinaceae bacterium]|nr:hypothetical protein [Nitrospinaceae bacterium]NIR54873.1 hypothetical protein [Nitrospinaceae bacterium]NIS85298.1 hypothetical protein [Nitrospinaceae bacterium]NIT82111.1 hypothetical protein [Nitrospinaceae bacterium]NIU44372.1 hypothetical protein [Nitrospinaceae bacterium]